jgi:hypothetical protein
VPPSTYGYTESDPGRRCRALKRPPGFSQRYLSEHRTGYYGSRPGRQSIAAVSPGISNTIALGDAQDGRGLLTAPLGSGHGYQG